MLQKSDRGRNPAALRELKNSDSLRRRRTQKSWCSADLGPELRCNCAFIGLICAVSSGQSAWADWLICSQTVTKWQELLWLQIVRSSYKGRELLWVIGNYKVLQSLGIVREYKQLHL